MLTWSPIFHFYQPIHSDDHIVRQILYSCYLPVLELFLHNKDAEATFHISGSLTLVLERMGYDDFFVKTRELIERGQVELITSPVYHPIMPLTPDDALQRQLQQSREIMEYFYHTSGEKILFPPELAVDEHILTEIGKQFDYVIVDQSSLGKKNWNIPFYSNPVLSYANTNLVVSNRMLTAIFRAYPNWINQEALIEYIKKNNTDNLPLIHANDIEIFGHHYEERIHVLNELVSHREITMQKVTNALKDIKPTLIDHIKASTWQTFPEEHTANTPFSMWIDPNNNLQGMYYDLMEQTHTALAMTPPPEKDINLVYTSAQKHFDIGTASCHSYWLSNKPWWHPEIAEAGATHLIKCVRSLPVPNKFKQKAEGLYTEFLKQMWQRNWSDVIKENYKRYNEFRKRQLQRLPDVK